MDERGATTRRAQTEVGDRDESVEDVAGLELNGKACLPNDIEQLTARTIVTLYSKQYVTTLAGSPTQPG